MASENGKVGNNILGDVHWEDLGNGRVRCVETGHEMIESAKDGYVSTKKCRLALFEGALRNRKPPLHMFDQSPDARDKIVCKLTGAVMNKQEDAVWKHMLGKKFQRKLEEKEVEKKKTIAVADASGSNRTLAVQGAQKLEGSKSKCNGGPPKKKLKSNSALSDSTLNASLDGDEIKGEDAVTTNGRRQKKKKIRVADDTSMETAIEDDVAQDEDPTKSESSMLKKQQRTHNALGESHMGAGDVVMEEDAAASSEDDFWIPPVGHRWDMDVGGNNRWSSKNHDLSGPQKQADDMDYSEEEEA